MFDTYEYHRQYMSDRYYRRKAEGVCVYCGGEKEAGCTFVACAPCREKKNVYDKKYHEEVKELIRRRRNE